jgi:zinc protease
VTAEAQIPELGVTTWTLSNGVKVWVKPTDFKADEIRISAFSPGGTSRASDADFVAAVTAGDVRGASGLGELRARSLEKRLAGVDVSVSPFVGPWFEGVQAASSQKDLPTALQLVWLSFTAPRFDDDGLKLAHDSSEARLRNRTADPNAVFQDQLTKTLWSDAPRYRPWTVDTLAGMDLAKSKAFWQDRFGDAADFTFVVVGNVDPATLKPLVEQWLGSLPAAPRTDGWVDDKARMVGGVHADTLAKGIEPKARVRRIYNGSFTSTWESRNHLQAMGDVLQVLLRERLREALGGTYHVGVNTWVGEVPVGQYQVSIDFECDPTRVAELQKAADEVIATLRTQGPPADVVEREQAENLRGHEVDLKENGWWTSALVGALQRGEDPKDLLGYEARNAALTPAVIRDAAKTWLDPKRYVQETLVPAAPVEAAAPAPAKGG